jgi:hypothetical protein
VVENLEDIKIIVVEVLELEVVDQVVWVRKMLTLVLTILVLVEVVLVDSREHIMVMVVQGAKE